MRVSIPTRLERRVQPAYLYELAAYQTFQSPPASRGGCNLIEALADIEHGRWFQSPPASRGGCNRQDVHGIRRVNNDGTRL